MFANRQKELNILEKRYQSHESELLIIYGRRRVGKTELIREFIKNKPHVYYMADTRIEKEQLELYSSIVGEYYSDPVISSQPLGNWELVFQYLNSRLQGKKDPILIFDEFPYLVETSAALPSIIQRHWDHYLKSANVYMILCGSSMSFMEREVLSYKSPLYGRRTAQLEILPFGVREIQAMFPRLSPEHLVELFAVYGGIPAYLRFFNPQKSLIQNIKETIIPPESFLHNEVNFLLMEELRSPQSYFAILRALAFGKTRVNEIVQLTGLERGVVGKYLDHFIELRIVERKIPVTENPVKSRKGIYIICDNYVRFWFKYIYPNRTYVEEGRQEMVLDKIKKDFQAFVGPIFESVATEYIRSHYQGRNQSFVKLGSWWDKGEEIDIVGIDENGDVLLVECKWSNKKVGVNIYYRLKEKRELLPERNGQVSYMLVSKRGFTRAMQKLARQENVQLVSANDMFRQS